MLKMVKKWWEKQPWAKAKKKTEPKVKKEKVITTIINCIPYNYDEWEGSGYYSKYMSWGTFQTEDWSSDKNMNKSKWEKMGRTGFGNHLFQEYSLDEKGYVYILTKEPNSEFPQHLPYITETLEVVGQINTGTIFKMALAE